MKHIAISFNYTINYWLDNGLEKDKLILGMPFYGQTFKLANANDNGLNAKAFGGATGGEFTKSEGFLSYYEVIQVNQTELHSHYRIIED